MINDTEATLLTAIVNPILRARFRPKELIREQSGHYADGTRRVVLDTKNLHAGTAIGAGGRIKLAIQTVVAAPFGADAMQIRFTGPGGDRIHYPHEQQEPQSREVDDLMEALCRHLDPQGQNGFTYRVEGAASAVLVILEIRQPFLRELRGPLNHLLRTVGQAGGFHCLAAIEQPRNALAG